jgi:hypothetical protein
VKLNERDEALEIIQGMTKAEIIGWLSGEIGFLLRPPRKSQLLFGRYQAAAIAAMERRNKNTLADGVAKKIDALCIQLSRAKDHREFTAIAKEMEPYEKAFKKWIGEIKEIEKEEKKVDALFAAYMEQSDRESGRRPAEGKEA